MRFQRVQQVQRVQKAAASSLRAISFKIPLREMKNHTSGLSIARAVIWPYPKRRLTLYNLKGARRHPLHHLNLPAPGGPFTIFPLPIILNIEEVFDYGIYFDLPCLRAEADFV